METVIEIIVGSARTHGVDPYTAVACATEESGLDPTRVGDGGTSFGLFQLHEGGELGTLTKDQAFDPQTNADVALSEMGLITAAHPTWTPGEIAAASQRPADPTFYAVAVNAIYREICSPGHTQLWRLLQLTPMFMRGSDVRMLQYRLGLAADGVYGPVTTAAVQAFQAHHSLVDDGIVGPKTCQVLGWTWDA